MANNNIVVLDGFTLNPGDLSWSEIGKLGNLMVYDRTDASDTIERAKQASIILTNKTIIDESVIDSLANLKYIGVLATGYNVVDCAAAARKGIIVTNIPAYSTMSVAQMVFSHILNIYTHVKLHSDLVKAGRWSENKDFCFWETPQLELAGKTIGLFGLGHTGMATAHIALAFGMKVIAVTSKPAGSLPQGITPVSKERFFAESDIISLHCPLTPETTGLVNESALSLMKPSAIVINTGRGPLVNEHDLAVALNDCRIFGAGVDVLSTEPPKADNPLLGARNCYITPHIAWATIEARQRLMKIAGENIEAFLNGNIQNKVN